MNEPKEKRDIISAAEIYWGEFLPIDDMEIVLEKTPETILLEKDPLNFLTEECRLLANILLNLPEEMTRLNGSVKIRPLTQFVNKQLGWGGTKLQTIMRRLVHDLNYYHNRL